MNKRLALILAGGVVAALIAISTSYNCQPCVDALKVAATSIADALNNPQAVSTTTP